MHIRQRLVTCNIILHILDVDIQRWLDWESKYTVWQLVGLLVLFKQEKHNFILFSI